MTDFPFDECAAEADRKIGEGWTIFQKFTCAHCGTRQTMPDPNKFYVWGKCEECKGETNIVERGCNYMAIWSTK